MKGNNFFLEIKKTSILNGPKETFANYFSTMDVIGLTSFLKDDVLYDKLSKQDWIVLFENQFESFKSNNIHSLKPITGVCMGCKRGCSGYTFLDEVSGFYVDLVIEVNEEGGIDFTDCTNLKNKILIPYKIEQIFINNKSLNDEMDAVPF